MIEFSKLKPPRSELMLVTLQIIAVVNISKLVILSSLARGDDKAKLTPLSSAKIAAQMSKNTFIIVSLKVNNFIMIRKFK